MLEITFMKTVRDIINTAINECNIQEYKPEYILKQFNKKLDNVRANIDSMALNRNQKAKYYKVLDNTKLPYMNAKHYDLMIVDFRNRISELPSMIQFIKK